MALQVWLPLNGSMENQGLLNLTPTQQGTISWIDGKIGKCLSAGNANQTANGISYDSNLTAELGTEFSAAVWVKPLGNHVHYNGTFVSSGNWNAKRWAFGVNQNNSAVDVFCQGHNTYINCSVPVNTWTHLCCIHQGTTVKLYKNGEYIGEKTGVTEGLESDATNFCVGRETYASGYFSFNGNLNDLRIYDHALSLKEIKELSKGLVLHYKLDKIKQTLVNAYNYPTFNTSTANAGWNHWGRTNAVGTYGQNQDKQYIFRPNQQYSHWVANASTATMDTGGYLFYQSPAFEGGYRSIQCIVKEENSLPITEEIVMPAWNARDGGAEQNIWTSIESLGNGFYLCKCEGIHQNGSNDLIGFYIGPGYKVYFSEAYCEDDKEKCTDIFSLEDFELDCSGYNYNAVPMTENLKLSKDTIKYSYSTHFEASDYIKLESPNSEIKTISLWAKWDSIPSGQSIIFVDYKSKLGLGLMSSGILCGTSGPGNYYTYNKSGIIANTWYHFVVINPGDVTSTSRKLYINGIEQTSTTSTSNWTYAVNEMQIGKRSTSSDGFAGLISDFRAYATALSEEDVLELYHTAASIDNQGNLFCGEVVE